MRSIWKTMNRQFSVFHSWLLSYALIIAIALASSGILYVQASDIVEEEIHKANAALLNQVKQDLDGRVEEMERLSMQVFLNPRLQVLMHASLPLSESQRFSIYQLIQDFKGHGATNSFIRGFYVYIPQLRQAFASDGAYSERRLYELFHQEENIGYEAWLNAVTALHSRHFTALSGGTAGDGRRTFAYLQSFPVGSSQTPLANMVVLVQEERLRQMLENIEWLHQGVLILADEEGRIITSTAPVDGAGLGLEKLRGSGLMNRELNGEKMAVSYTTSEKTGWKYIAVVPSGTFFNKLSLIRRIAAASMVLGLAASGFAALFFARRNYGPIRGLLEMFIGSGREVQGDGPAGAAAPQNEYHVIREMISRTLNEKSRIRDELNEHNAAVKAGFLARLIKGRVSGVPLHDSLSAFDIGFVSDSFAVVAVHLERYGKLERGEPDGPDAGEAERLAVFIVKNVVEELAGEQQRVWVTEIEELLVCLFNFRKEAGPDAASELIRVVNTAQLFVQEKFGIRFTAAASAVVHSVRGVPQSYAQALEALEHKFVMGGGRIILYEHLEPPKGRYYYPIEKEQQLINCIKIGDYAGSRAVLNEIFDRNLSSAGLSVEMVKCLIFDMTSTVVKTLDELGLTGEGELLERVGPVDRLAHCEDVFQMREQMFDIVRLVCEHVDGRKRSRNAGLKDTIEAYVRDHLADFNLSISWIAEELNMNASYLSRYYKEQAGESLVDYINKTRIEAAKRLLRRDELTMSDIAERVGYSSNVALIRAFKRYEGITPGKYKELV